MSQLPSSVGSFVWPFGINYRNLALTALPDLRGVISLRLPKVWRGLIRFDPVAAIEVDSLSAVSIFESDAHRRRKMLSDGIGLRVP